MAAKKERSPQVGVVAIGRNEGQRLQRCISSVLHQRPRAMVYVDSASTDDSVPFARSQGVEVVELDLSQPFTAARARNSGIRRLLEKHPNIEYVQVVDGDCELVDGWLEAALDHMVRHPDLAAVAGRRREERREASIYNRLCDMEWDVPPGEAASCGGDALLRVTALRQVDGYRDTLIAGEEPEMCYRLRKKGWKIEILKREMTVHDARMTQFGQWWKRTTRSGHAYAEVYWTHHQDPTPPWSREVRSIVGWAFVVPVLAFSLGTVSRPARTLALSGYFLLWDRVRRYRLARGDSPQDAALYALSCAAGKFPQLVGVLTFAANRVRGRRTSLIEYQNRAPRPEVSSPSAAEI